MHLGILQAIATFFTLILLLPSHTTKATWGLIVQTTGGVLILDSLTPHLQYYSAERVDLQPKHKVINTSSFLVNPTLITRAVFLYIKRDFTRAAQQEEVLLINTLPGYMDYALRIPRFLPRPWRSG